MADYPIPLSAASIEAALLKVHNDQITKSEVGLGNVDNTSDANKPVSTAQATAIAAAEQNAKDYADTLSNGGGLTIESFGAVGDGIADDSTALENALRSEQYIVSDHTKKYRITRQITAPSKTVNVNFGGATIIEDTTASIPILFQNSIGTPQNVSSIDTVLVEEAGTSLVSRLNLAVAPTVTAGKFVKIVSDDLIASNVANKRQGEFAKVDRVEGNTIVLTTNLILPHATNIRVVEIDSTKSFRLENLKYDVTDPNKTATFASISIESYVKPEVYDAHIAKGSTMFLRFNNCIEARTDKIFGRQLKDDTAATNYGYVIADYSCQGSFHNLIEGDSVRHVYTTGGTDVSANGDTRNYGACVNCTVNVLVAKDCSGGSADTHPAAINTVFNKIIDHNSVERSSTVGSAIQLRGINDYVGELVKSGRGGALMVVGTGINPKVGKITILNSLDYYAISSSGTDITTNLEIDELNLVWDKHLTNIISNFAGNISIKKTNITFTPNAILNTAIRLQAHCLAGGKYRFDEVNIHADKLTGNTLNSSALHLFYPTQTDVDIASLDLHANYYVNDNSISLATGHHCRLNKTTADRTIGRGNMSCNIYHNEAVASDTLNRAFILGVQPSENVVGYWSINDGLVSTNKGHWIVDSTTEDLFFGENTFNNRTYPVPDARDISMTLEGTVSGAKVISMPAPKRAGQILSLSVIPGSSNPVIIGASLTIQNVDITVNAGQSVRFIAVDSAGLKWSKIVYI